MKRLVLVWILVWGCSEPPATPEAPVPPLPAAQELSTPAPIPAEPSASAPLLNATRFEGHQGPRFSLVHQSNSMGELDDCGCNIKPLGGLARRVQWLRTHQEKLPGLLYVDAGDFLGTGEDSDRPGTPGHPLALGRADLVVDAMNRAGCIAAVLGDRDLALGPDAIKKLDAASSFPFLAANVVRQDRPLVPTPYLIHTQQDRKIGFIGLVSDRLPLSEYLEKDHGIRIQNPYETLKSKLPELLRKVDHVVVLAHLKEGEMEIIAEEFPSVALVLGGQDIRSPERHTWIEGTPSTSGGEKGKELYVTSWALTPAQTNAFHDPTARAALESRVEGLKSRLQERVAALERAKTKGDENTNLDWLQKNVVKLKVEMQGLQMDLADLPDETSATTLNQVVFDRIELATSLPEEVETQGKVQALKKKYPALEKPKVEEKP